MICCSLRRSLLFPPSKLTHLAAQAPSDAPIICTWYDRFFTRQGSFPILTRSLSG